MEQMNRGAEMYCLGCLCSGNEYKIQEYNMKHYDHFMAISDVASLKLCYLCRAMAQHAELFIRNVHRNQIILENYFEACTLSSCMKPESKGTKPISLSFSITLTDSVQDNDSHNNHTSEGSFTHTVANTTGVIQTELLNTFSNIKKVLKRRPDPHSVISADELTAVSCEEVKRELDINVHSELESDDDYENDSPIKQENLPLMQHTDKSSPKEEEDNKTGLTMTDKKKLTSKEVLEAVKEKDDEYGIDIVRISLDQCMEERRLKALDPSYLAHPYKCDDCVKGFSQRATYEGHRRQWHGAAGGAVCSVCSMRLPSTTSLSAHKRQHTVRYRCRECGLSTPHQPVAVAHVQSTHRTATHACPHCHKRFQRHLSYKKHIKDVHQRTGKFICDLCNKSYFSKEGLRAHMVQKHPAAVGAPPPERPLERMHRCPQCPAAFTLRSGLRAHARTHSDHRPHYCVECDKGYKTAGGFNRHFQTAPAHVDKSNMPSCPQCHKRFTSEIGRDRHIDAVHLDRRPHKCHLCDKSFVIPTELRRHVRKKHEGYKPPRKHLCNYCEQAFTTRRFLTAHIRRHTGERPFQCTDCDATFSYSAALYTHNRLKHKRLTKKETTKKGQETN